MDGETMKTSLDDILSSKGRTKDFKITPEEATRFKSAMADPQFQAMLRDYMEDMQDPKLKAEQEAYITQLEGQNRVPAGKEVVHPMAGFVIKTKYTREGQEGESQKLFVNVVTSNKISPPKSTRSSKNGNGGEMWSLPHAVGPMRMEKDKAGQSTTAFDACFHPEALVRAKKLDAFRNLVSTSALDAVEQNFHKAVGQKITVEKKFRVLVGVTYKSGACSTMLLSKEDVHQEPAEQPTASTDENKPPAPPAEAKVAKGGVKREGKWKANTPSSVFSGQEMAPTPSAPVAAAKALPTDEDAVAEAKPERRDGSPLSPPSLATPLSPLSNGEKRGTNGAKYKLVESGAFEISDHTEDRVRPPGVTVPQRLVVTVTLPENAEPTRKLDVVVSSRRLTIGVAGDSEDQPPRYLDMSLPYAVEDESKCSAKRAKRGALTITMPVRHVVAPPRPPLRRELSDTEIPSEDAKEGEGQGSHNVGGARTAPTNREVDHSRWVREAPSGERFEFSATEDEARSKMVETQGNDDDNDDSNAREMIAKRAAEGDPFFALGRFVKAVPGYHFKTGEQGPGYYREPGQEPPIEWNQTVATMVGLVQVAGIIEDTIRMDFSEDEKTVALSFWSADHSESVSERAFFSIELDVPGRVNVDKCTFGRADANLLIRLVKNPPCEWPSVPRSLTEHEQSQSDKTGTDLHELIQSLPKEQSLAPGHGGGGRMIGTRKQNFEGLAYQLD